MAGTQGLTRIPSNWGLSPERPTPSVHRDWHHPYTGWGEPRPLHPFPKPTEGRGLPPYSSTSAAAGSPWVATSQHPISRLRRGLGQRYRGCRETSPSPKPALQTPRDGFALQRWDFGTARPGWEQPRQQPPHHRHPPQPPPEPVHTRESGAGGRVTPSPASPHRAMCLLPFVHIT